MKELLGLFEFVKEPITLRKICRLLFFLALILALVGFYEIYTRSFELARLQRSAQLLKELQELSQTATNLPPEMLTARSNLFLYAGRAISAPPLGINFKPSPLEVSWHLLWKFLAGGAIWFITAVYQFFKARTAKARKEVSGALLIGVVSGLISLFFPPIWWPLFHLFVYPVIFLLALVLVATPFAIFASAASRAKSKAQEANCSNNLKLLGLASRTWALEHHDQMPSNLEEIAKEARSEKVMKCPTSGVDYQLDAPSVPSNEFSKTFLHCDTHQKCLLVSGEVRNSSDLKGSSTS